MKILHSLIEDCKDSPVKDVVVGIFNTLVIAERVGIASTLRPVKDEGGILPETISGKTTKSLAQLSLSENPIEASIGIAAINASVSIPEHFVEIDGRELFLKMGKGRICACIGHFPFIQKLEPMLKKLYTFEKKPTGGDLPEEKIPDFLPLADVVLITGMTLTNHSFEGVMKHVKKGAYVLFMGPSVPVSPILFDFGIDALCGTLVIEPDIVREQIKMGVCYKDIKGLKKVCITRERMYG